MNEWANEWMNANCPSTGPPPQGCSTVLGANAVSRCWRWTRAPVWSSVIIHTYTREVHHPNLHSVSYSQKLSWLLPCGGLDVSAKAGWLGSCLPRGTRPLSSLFLPLPCRGCSAEEHRFCLLFALKGPVLISPPRDTLCPWLPFALFSANLLHSS